MSSTALLKAAPPERMLRLEDGRRLAARLWGDRGRVRTPRRDHQRLDDGIARVSGSMTIDDFNEITGTALPVQGPRTLAGLVFDALGRRPKPGDAVTIADVAMHVEHVEGTRITRLMVTTPRPGQAVAQTTDR